MTLAGLKRDFALLNPMYLKIYLDLQMAVKPGPHLVNLSEREIQLPKELHLVQFDPSSVAVQLELTETKTETTGSHRSTDEIPELKK